MSKTYELTAREVRHLCIQAIATSIFEILTPEQWDEWVKARLDDPHYFEFYGFREHRKEEA